MVNNSEFIAVVQVLRGEGNPKISFIFVLYPHIYIEHACIFLGFIVAQIKYAIF